MTAGDPPIGAPGIGSTARQDEARAYYAALEASGEAPISEKVLKQKKR